MPPGGPPPSSGHGGGDNQHGIPDSHPPDPQHRPNFPPPNHKSWPRPGSWTPWHPPQNRRFPGQFRPRPLNRPRLAWLPASNIPLWLCQYVMQIYGKDPNCCLKSAGYYGGGSNNIMNFEVENCLWCDDPHC
jgi:hypothetical protein